MFSLVVLLLIPFATSVSASSVSTVSLTKFRRTGPGVGVAGRARAAFLKSPDGATTVPATSVSYVQYTTNVGIGNPPTYYNLAIDSGSSNTFCGTGIPYVRTSTSISTGENVNVTYGAGNFSGVEYLDQVTLAPNLVITNQSIGDALQYADFLGIDGLLGVGPVDLTNGTLNPDRNETVPTVMNNLVSQKIIKRQILSVYFAPSTNYNDTNGALTYGGINSSLYEGELMYTPVTNTYPASKYWGINVTMAAYSNYTIIPNSTAGIVDTGTTQILLADDFFTVYMSAIPGATYNSSLGAIQIPPSSIAYMQPLNFTIDDWVFTMDVAAQLFPTDENTAMGGEVGIQYGVVGNLGFSSGQGLDFVLGQTFMERYYAVFDADNNRVGFAQTNNTFTQYQG